MSPRRYELTDFEWSIVQGLLSNKPRCVPRVDDRRVINRIYWRMRTDSSGPRSLSAMGRTRPATTASFRWARLGGWDRIFAAISQAYDGDLQMIDASSIRLHQHGGNVKGGGRTPRQPRLGTTLEQRGKRRVAD